MSEKTKKSKKKLRKPLRLPLFFDNLWLLINKIIMGKDTNYFGQPVFQQATKLIKKTDVVSIAQEFKADRYTKKLDTYNQLMIMLFGVFKAFDGLRELILGAEAEKVRLYRMGIKVPARSTLADANKNRSADVFKAIYFKMYEKLRPLLSDSSRNEWEKKLTIIDSTTITLFTDILKGAGRKPKLGKKKGGIKVHTQIRYAEWTPSLIKYTSAATHDSNFLEDIALEPSDILVMDRAYIDYAFMESLTKKGVCYVTKMKKSLRYKTLESEYVVSQDGKVEAKISKIILRKVGKNEKVEVEHNARLVEYWTIDKYGKKKYARLVTNDLESDFHKIIDIYDHRWQIELLFKQLKQNFQLRYFYGDSVNAIETQIWVTLIANLLMTVVQKQLKNRYPNRQFCFSNIICLTRNMLMYYIDMYKLIYNPEKEWNAVNRKLFDTQMKIQF